MRKKSIVAFTIVLLVFTIGIQTSFAATPFRDVPSNHWAANAISQMAANGYIEGYPGNVYRPNNQVTRAEFATFLARMIDTDEVAQHSFTDVPGSHWSTAAINKGIALGFIQPSDFPNNRFEPNRNMTRVEMAKWMANGLAAIDESYQDAIKDSEGTLLPITEYYGGGLQQRDIPYVSVVLGTGLMRGYTDGSFGPSRTTTRAEVAVLLTRLQDVMGKTADDFRDLAEFRAVGVEGTNIGVITEYRQFCSFADVRNQPIQLRNNVGTVKINRLIFLGGNSSNVIGAYAPMFYHPNMARIIDGRAEYLLFIEKSLQSNIPYDNRFMAAYGNSSLNGLVYGQRLPDSNVPQYNLATNYDASLAFHKEIGTDYYWEHRTIGLGNHSLEPTNNSFFRISPPLN